MEKPEQIHSRRRKNRSQQQPRGRGVLRNTESLLARQLLRALGFIFIMASLWVAFRSAGDLMHVFKNLGFTGKKGEPSGLALAVPSTVAAATAAKWWVLLLWGVLTGLVLTLFIYLSVRFRRREIPRLLVPVFYAFIILTATRFKWPVHLFFPLALFFSALLYWAYRKLNTPLANWLNVIFGWSFFALWWGLKWISGPDKNLLVSFYIYSTLLFVAFYIMGLARGFHGFRKSSVYIEILVIAANISLYFLILAATLYTFGGKDWIWVFSLTMGIQIFAVQAWVEKKGMERIGYILPGMVFISLVLPLLAHCNFMVLFFGAGSVLLMLYSRASQEKWGLVLSLAAMALMLGAYFFDWIFSYLPFVLLRDVLKEPELLKKGLIASVFILPVIWVNEKMVRESDLGLSKKWFSRHRYARIYNGFFWSVAYFAGFLAIHFFLMNGLKNGEARWLSWSIFTFFYFLVLVPVLAKQKSSLLRTALWVSLLVALAWPLFVHFHFLELRNEALLRNGFSPLPFYAHYLGLFLLILLLFVTGYQFFRTHRQNLALVHGVQAYLMLMGLFLLLSEFDHLVVLLNYRPGLRIEDIVRVNHKIPFTFLVFGFAIPILVYGFFRSNRFLRIFALLLVVVAMGKLAYIDFEVLSETGKVVLLFVLGGVLLVFSFIYPRIKRYFDRTGPEGHSHSHSHHHHPRQQP